MADLVTVDGIGYKRRNPWGVFGLSLLTLGVYYVVWWYKINNEMRNYGIVNEPAKATLGHVVLDGLEVDALLAQQHEQAAAVEQVFFS